MPRRSDLVAWDHRYLWHPFTQMQEWLAEEPLVVAKAQGNYLVDVRGRRYLDGVASLWCNVHGHRHPRLDRALRRQIGRVAHSTLLGLANVPSIECARELVSVAPPGLTRVFYSDSGATAVEVALRMAAQYWQLVGAPRRTRFVSLTEGYHGDTLGAVSVGYSETFHRFVRPLLFEALKLDPPHAFRWHRRLPPEEAEAEALAQARETFSRHAEEIAALVIEPIVQGAAGMWTHSPRYLREVARLAKEAGALVICDEVATGFGRTGRMFAVEHAELSPDLLCLGKGITGGYMALAATLAREEIFEAFLGPYEEFRAFFYGHTYTGNPLACAVALENLRIFREEATVEKARALSRVLADLLERFVAPLPAVGDIRQAGCMIGIELVRDRETRLAYKPRDRIGARVCGEVRRYGVVLRPLGSVIVLMPPLSLRSDEAEHLVRSTAQAIADVTRMA